MDAYSFWQYHGTDLVITLCDRADTTFSYYKHIMHGRSRPSVDKARALVKASAEMIEDPDLRLDLDSLLPPKTPRISKLRQQGSASLS
jgi:transcriptional regulator with XRE-family HTH domain